MNMFDQGNRVMTPGGAGTVVYRRMKAPDYYEVAAYSVRLDRLSGVVGYCGNIYLAHEVKALEK